GWRRRARYMTRSLQMPRDSPRRFSVEDALDITQSPAGAGAHWRTALKCLLPPTLPVVFALVAWQMDRASIMVAADAYRSPLTVATNALPAMLLWLAALIATRRLVFSFFLALGAQALV